MTQKIYPLLRAQYDRQLLRGEITPRQHKRLTGALERAHAREKERLRARRALKKQLEQSLAEDGA